MRRLKDVEYAKYLKRYYPNSKKKKCPKCGDTAQYTHYKFCDQCGYEFKKK